MAKFSKGGGGVLTRDGGGVRATLKSASKVCDGVKEMMMLLLMQSEADACQIKDVLCMYGSSLRRSIYCKSTIYIKLFSLSTLRGGVLLILSHPETDVEE